jgi:hypothetical protein
MVVPSRDFASEVGDNFFDDAETTEELLGYLAGAVSICWSPTPTGVFESSAAARFLEVAIKRLAVLTQPTEPYLGLATTQSLLDEIAARFVTHGLPLSYRTVDN